MTQDREGTNADELGIYFIYKKDKIRKTIKKFNFSLDSELVLEHISNSK